MARHKPDITSAAVLRRNEIKTVDEQLGRLSRTFRLSQNPAVLDEIDRLLDKRSGLSCSLGEMLNIEDRASLTEWGAPDLGTSP